MSEGKRWMWLMSGLLVSILLSSQIHGGVQLSTSPEYYYARYRINGVRPKEFAEVAYLVVGVKHNRNATTYDEKGNALIRGELLTVDGMRYQFTTAKLIRSTILRRDGCGLFTNLNLVTDSKQGTSYRFDGEFLQEPERLGKGNYTDLRGVFTKFKDGLKVAEAKVHFTKLGIE
jgi:hypothetical protein